MAACWGTWTWRDVLSVATGAGALYLLYKTISNGLNSLPSTAGPHDPEGLSMKETMGSRVRGELEKLLGLLRVEQDGDSRGPILNSIGRCICLLESEAFPCSPEDIQRVIFCLDDPSNETKLQALNALRAFTTQNEFKAQIQEQFPKVLELTMTTWDMETCAAGLQLLNSLEVTPAVKPLLRHQLSKLLQIVLNDHEACQVQVLKLLATLCRRGGFLHDILSCEVPQDFLTILDTTLSSKVQYELLVLLEVLHEGCAQPLSPPTCGEPETCSLYEALFGESSYLSHYLLAMFVHPEEDVQLQACKVILSLQFSKPARTITATPLSSHSFNTTFEFPLSPRHQQDSELEDISSE